MDNAYNKLEEINDELHELFISEYHRGYDEGYDKGYNDIQRNITVAITHSDNSSRVYKDTSMYQVYDDGVTAAWTLMQKLLRMNTEDLLKLKSDDNYCSGIELLKQVTKHGYYSVNQRLAELETKTVDVKVGDEVYIDKVPEAKYVVVYKDTLEGRVHLINKDGITSTAPLDMIHTTGNFLDVKQFVSKFIAD